MNAVTNSALLSTPPMPTRIGGRAAGLTGVLTLEAKRQPCPCRKMMETLRSALPNRMP